MPEYQATIKSNVKGVNSRKIKLLASCYSDAEKDVNKSLTEGEYLHSLDNVNFSDKFNVVERR
jgi:hypothetical protein